MADFETKLRWLSERGNPVGAEELIDRIEADLAGDPLVVVAIRREGTLMTKTEQTPTTKPPSRNRGAAWAVAAFVAILAVAGLYIGLEGGSDGDAVADTQPTPTTAAGNVAAAYLETVEAGVAAFYSGDGDRAAELFELAERTDDQIREEAEYRAATEGRMTVSCIGGEGGVFNCHISSENILTDALGIVEEVDEGGSGTRVVVEDGVITEFDFPEDSWTLTAMGLFLASEGRFEGWEVCWSGPFPVSCAAIQLENRDAWAEWLYQSFGQFVEGGELADEYAAADCANTRSHECASLISDNFDAWETWYNENA